VFINTTTREVDRGQTLYLRFHLYSNCRMLCIIPGNSLFLTRLINAALGLRLPLKLGKGGIKFLETAYLFFEFSFSHRTGSCFLSQEMLAVVGWKVSNSWISGRAGRFSGWKVKARRRNAVKMRASERYCSNLLRE
jgi:hypothetical protein